FAKVHSHRLGDPQPDDALVYERPEDKELFPVATVTRDGRFLVLTTFKGASGKAEVQVRDLRGAAMSLRPLFTGFAHDASFVGEVDGRFFFRTDERAPRGRLLAFDVAGGGRDAIEVLPGGEDKLEGAAIVARRIVALRLKDASSRIALHDLDGRALGEIRLPGLGTVTGLTGEPDDEEMFLGFTSFTQPAAPLRWDFAGASLQPFESATPTSDEDEVEQVFFASRAGARVPMFVVRRRGLPRDGRRPTILYGYGGFDISLTPTFNAATRLWLERGGVYAVANLRGGGEYGE